MKHHLTRRKEGLLPKVNYKYEKRKRDIAKQKKREEKLRRRQERKQQDESAPVEVNEGGEESGEGSTE